MTQLTDASVPHKRAALDIARAALAQASRRRARSAIIRGAAILLKEPWKLEFIVAGAAQMDAEDLLAETRRLKDVMRDLGHRGHFAYDGNLMIARRQAYVAVRIARLRQRAGVMREAAE